MSSRHTQFAMEINRRLFQTKRERRIEAGWALLKALLGVGVFAAIGVLLAWRG
jgi:hypothetical protein